MLLRICEGSHRIVRGVHQSPKKELRCFRAEGVVKVPPFLTLVVKVDTFYAGLA